MALGLPVEGTKAAEPNAGNLARRDVATCSPDDTVATARQRAADAGGVCVVVNDQRIVFGVLREEELAGDGDALVSDVMRCGPSTFRPHVSAKEMADYMTKHNVANAPVTTADGKLVGVLFRDAVVKAAESRP
jgi:CBS domain-containing protein